jgi:hypothetical protein
VDILPTLRLGLAAGVSTFAMLLGDPLGCFGVRILRTRNIPICPPAFCRRRAGVDFGNCGQFCPQF